MAVARWHCDEAQYSQVSAMKQLRVGDLFSGIGGFSLGLERAGGFKTQWFVEIDPYCQRVLAKHWPHVPRYGDIKAIDRKSTRLNSSH